VELEQTNEFYCSYYCYEMALLLVNKVVPYHPCLFKLLVVVAVVRLSRPSREVLKKNGLKTTGKKATLTRRAKKAHLKMKGGDDDKINGTGAMGGEYDGGKKKRSRRSRGIFGKLF
jgi:hypothetical protein